MTHKRALERILDQFVGMNLNDLTRAEQNIMDFACIALGAIMPTNRHAEFMRPEYYKKEK